MSIETSFPLTDEVNRAFELVYWVGKQDEHVEAFASHWGGIEREHFQQALQSEVEDERLLAVFALGLSATAEAADLIAPFLSLPFRRERWASAFCLGRMKDDRAFPVLESLLLDGLSEADYRDDETLRAELAWCNGYRASIVALLADWHSPTLVETMKEAFAALWRWQKHVHPSGFDPSGYDALAYALGQRGDFAVCDGLDLPLAYINVARIYLAMGELLVQAFSSPSSLPDQISELRSAFSSDEPLQQAVARVLETRFGLSVTQQEACLDDFYDNSHQRETYGNPEVDFFADLGEEQADEEEEDEADEIQEPESTSPVCWYRKHTARIQSLAWSPDGTSIVSGSEDGTAQVWNRTTGETVTVFRGHQGSVNLVAWSPQGDWIASGGSDGVVYVWRAWSGEVRVSYHGHQSWLWGGLAWSPDGTRIASTSLDRTVQIWHALSGEQLLTYRGHAGIIASLAWSPDGTQIVSGGGYPECRIHLWNAQTGALHLSYLDHQRDDLNQRPLSGRILREYDSDSERWLRGASSVHALSWSPDGTHIASAGLRTVCRVWDAHSGQTLLASDRTEGPLIWSPDSVFLISAHSLHIVEIWNADTNQTMKVYRTRDLSDIKALACSSDGQWFAVSGRGIGPSSFNDRLVQVWRA